MAMGIDGIQGKRDGLTIERQRGQRADGSGRADMKRAEQEDSVELSTETLQFLNVRKLVDSVPEIRHDRVEHLKQQIAQGTYNVPATDIAEAILDEWI
jgi:flagellar biosynthesis anti-sigma factor FlgM